MTSDGEANERTSSSGTSLDATEYHRQLVSAILDIGVEHASPMQIYERMILPKDSSGSAFRHLQLGQIKSHLQRFRMVYRNEGPNNTEKKDFLDDYDSFVDYGLDSATARNDESHSSVMGGRIIGLVSRMVMMHDGVPIREFSKNHSTQETSSKGQDSADEGKSLDRKIPQLSSSEESSPVGQSIKLVVGLLEHLNNFIQSERQRAKAINKQATQDHSTMSFLPPLPNEQRNLKLPLSPPPHQLIHPDLIERLRIQQQQQQQQQQRTRQHLLNLKQSYANAIGQSAKSPSHHGRERSNSLSDVSCIGDDHEQSLATDEDLNFALLMPKPQDRNSNEPQDRPANERLGKFIPVKEANDSFDDDNNAMKLQGRVYPPTTDQTHRGNWNQNQMSETLPIQLPDVLSPTALLKTVVDLASQILPVPNIALSESSSNNLASSMSSTIPLGKSIPREESKTQQHIDPQKQKHHQPQISSSAPALMQSPTRKLAKYATTKLRQRYKHPNKKIMFKKLHKALSQIHFRRGKRSKDKRSNPQISGINSVTYKTASLASDDDSSVVSSLSSSSSSSSESGEFSDIDSSSTGKEEPGEKQPRGAQVSLTNVTSQSDETKAENKVDWMFDSFSMARRNLEVLSKGQQGADDDDEDIEDNSWCRRSSASTESGWGIVKRKRRSSRIGS